jgi:hypothetical protein
MQYVTVQAAYVAPKAVEQYNADVLAGVPLDQLVDYDYDAILFPVVAFVVDKTIVLLDPDEQQPEPDEAVDLGEYELIEVLSDGQIETRLTELREQEIEWREIKRQMSDGHVRMLIAVPYDPADWLPEDCTCGGDDENPCEACIEAAEAEAKQGCEQTCGTCAASEDEGAQPPNDGTEPEQ